MSATTPSLDLRSRLVFGIPGAAAAPGLSEGCFRKALPEIGKGTRIDRCSGKDFSAQEAWDVLVGVDEEPD